MSFKKEILIIIQKIEILIFCKIKITRPLGGRFRRKRKKNHIGNILSAAIIFFSIAVAQEILRFLRKRPPDSRVMWKVTPWTTSRGEERSYTAQAAVRGY